MAQQQLSSSSSSSSSSLFIEVPISDQINGYDCGIYVILITEILVEKFKNIPEVSEKVCCYYLNNNIFGFMRYHFK